MNRLFIVLNRLFTHSIAHLRINPIAVENDLLLINTLQRILEIQEEILVLLKNGNGNQLSQKKHPDLLQDLMDNVDIKSELNISQSTLYRLKRDNLINPVRIGRRDYYSISEIRKAIRRIHD